MTKFFDVRRGRAFTLAVTTLTASILISSNKGIGPKTTIEALSELTGREFVRKAPGLNRDLLMMNSTARVGQ